MTQQNASSALTAPLRGAASVLRKVPGATAVGRAAEETLDKVGAVSPRGRRIAVYAGAGVLGATGVVEWPVALTGAAVAWLTQPRPGPKDRPAGAGLPHDLGTAALRSHVDTPTHGPQQQPHRHHGEPGHGHRPARTRADDSEDTTPKTATGPLGPTARPDRTTR
ncbi:hypothetical protein [Streptomyces sp. KHY 26]|uniref:hypothetical protein n=1 Tax=Streptomyces sp. KHY 26 TaxID=3097359 RepID=UPI00376EA242